MWKRNRWLGRTGVAVMVAALALVSSRSSMAQEASAEVSTSGFSKATATGNTDHDLFAGSFAVGYFGVRSVPIAINPQVSEAGGVISMDASIGEVDAPVLGVRYWFNDGIGVDVGLGIRRWTGSAKWKRYERVPGDPEAAPREFSFEQDGVSQTGFLLHAGLPIAFAKEKHYVFELVPEANIGFSGGTVKDQAQRLPSADRDPVVRDDIKLSGFRLDIGARVGSEIHFGFMGIPNLALQASVGLMLSMQKIKADGGARPPADSSTTVSDAQPGTTFQASSMEISTTVRDTPWAIFENTVSALYYF
ncbi:MAG TPA: hypothetical protein PLJ27_01430 [Polyangiaceae bacterium]|nr:MAG: hypothetical protein BWY17_01336 [Deltaproteobacteria bacterium ADurb.Bin207]HNS95733.1 hypothetical protein [Polyangiaceae bacterium]HNZ22976.1 hypothetical protein [Polyangiaceae bacterium]HOD24066.1 hypothetical protein [Polyangiaceae bacterium]HOE51021.1 hypothetical protein [Polyangiaceae bacterium]